MELRHTPAGPCRRHRRDASPRRTARGRLHPAGRLQVERDHRRPPPQPRLRRHDLRRPVRPVHRHRGRDSRPGVVLATDRRQRHPGARQDHRRLRERRAGEERGADERLRRGDRAHRGRPRQRGQRREPVHRDERHRSSPRRSPTTSSRASPAAASWRSRAAAASRSSSAASTGPSSTAPQEVFLCGTGAQLSPVVEIDRRQIATGRPGPITRALSSTYFDAVRGRLDEYRDWLTPVY